MDGASFSCLDILICLRIVLANTFLLSYFPRDTPQLGGMLSFSTLASSTRRIYATTSTAIRVGLGAHGSFLRYGVARAVPLDRLRHGCCVSSSILLFA